MSLVVFVVTDLILEVRSVRQQGSLGAHASQDRLEELQAKVDSLEHQLEQELQKRGGRIEVDDPTFLRQFLSNEYQELPELMQAVVESGALDDLIRKRVEDQLYFLVSQGVVEYEPGWGWKRSERRTTMGDEWYSTVYENRHSEVNEFIQQQQNLGRSERTLNAYSLILREFFHDEFPDLTPGEVRVRHVEEYISTLTARGLAQNSKRRYLESISSFYSWAMNRPRFDDINGNPSAVVLEEIPTPCVNTRTVPPGQTGKS